MAQVAQVAQIFHYPRTRTHIRGECKTLPLAPLAPLEELDKMIDAQEPQEPPRKQGICSSCGAPTDRYATLCLIHQDDWHREMRGLRRCIRIGIYSDWPSGHVGHAQMQTDKGIMVTPQQRWDVVYATALAAMDVPLADYYDHDDSKWDALALVDESAAVARLMQELRDIGAFGNDAVA